MINPVSSNSLRITACSEDKLVTRIMYKMKQPSVEFVTKVTHGLGIDLIEVFGEFADKHSWSVR